MEQNLIQQLTEGFQLLWTFINVVFVIVFILLSWLTNDSAEANNAVSWMTWYDKIPKVLRTLGFGVLLAILFAWTFRYNERLDVFKMLMSIMTGMIVYKIGIDKALRWISKKVFGWEFPEKKEEKKPE